MNVSVHKPRPAETKSASMVLPKVNVRPPGDDLPAPAPHQASHPQEDTMRHLASPAVLAPAKTSGRQLPVWDIKFSLGLILLVIIVNLGLTLLLGTPAPLREEQQAVFKQPVAGEQGAPPVSASAREAKVFISGEDKRVLLRQLNAAPVATAPEKRPEEPGTYRSMGVDAPALSLTGANRPSLEQE